MNRRAFLVQLLVIAFTSGTVSFLVASPSVHANLFSDFLDKYLPSLKIENGLIQLKTENDQKPAENTVPYEAQDLHEEAVIKAVESASPSVVSVIISKDLPIIEQCPYDPFENLPPEFRQFFDRGFDYSQPCQKGTERKEVGGGSGFIISENGLIITNKHVVSDTKADYTVLTNDGKKYDAKVLARDPVQDIAVVQIEATGLKPLKIGNSDTIRLGQTAIAIGNSLGEFRNTVSVGVVSGLYRKITASDKLGGETETLEGLIQTDAAINPGNSGGPLLNLRGEVIGINTAVASGAENVGFTIPINKVKRDIDSVKANGKITIPYVGVRYLSINEDVADREKLNVKNGALIRGGKDGPAVVKNSPAAKAGILAEDIIIEVNGQKVDENNSFSSLIQKYQVGETVHLKIVRDGKELEISVILEERKF